MSNEKYNSVGVDIFSICDGLELISTVGCNIPQRIIPKNNDATESNTLFAMSIKAVKTKLQRTLEPSHFVCWAILIQILMQTIKP